MTDITQHIPQNVSQAVDRLMSDLSFHDKTKIANLSERQLKELHDSFKRYIISEFHLAGNDHLIEACTLMAGQPDLTPEQASWVIFVELRNRLQTSNVLRIVK